MRFQGILRVLQDPPLSGPENMARDAALLEVAEVPTLRFFLWAQPTLSLGRHQRVADLDASCIEAMGFTVVRRPTGGRAILHGDEVTFSFFLPRGEKDYSHRFLYELVRRVLIASFEDAGIHPDEVVSSRPFLASPVCFALSLPHEITVSGRKIAGVAQARGWRGNLFEGSIPLTLDRWHFARCFREKEKVYTELLEGALGLCEIRGDLSREFLVARMVERFGELFEGVSWGGWEERELEKAGELLGEYAFSPIAGEEKIGTLQEGGLAKSRGSG
uniref:BPL/LPL catalytic domain-containing protein n=1 Tax=Candidatus Caldatribacterium saccharofermentans TaxID=1454753 RepID=A0A7V4TXW5_9BACT